MCVPYPSDQNGTPVGGSGADTLLGGSSSPTVPSDLTPDLFTKLRALQAEQAAMPPDPRLRPAQEVDIPLPRPRVAPQVDIPLPRPRVAPEIGIPLPRMRVAPEVPGIPNPPMRPGPETGVGGGEGMTPEMWARVKALQDTGVDPGATAAPTFADVLSQLAGPQVQSLDPRTGLTAPRPETLPTNIFDTQEAVQASRTGAIPGAEGLYAPSYPAGAGGARPDPTRRLIPRSDGTTELAGTEPIDYTDMSPAGANWSEVAFPTGVQPGISAPLLPGATVPIPPPRPATPAAPVAPAPAPVAAAPAQAPVARTPGRDPLPQTSGHTDIVSQTGHDSLSPLADAIISRRSALPTPRIRPGETAAVPGTEPVASTMPSAGATVLSGGSANTGSRTPLAPGQLPDTNVMAAYIRKRATELGIDPNVAEQVARSEGLGASTWQSNLAGGGGPGNLEASFGPFQLYDKGMGADFTRQTGLRASDPNTWREQVDFVLGNASRTGWTPFHGAARVGIGPRQGLPAASDSSPSAAYAANGAPLIPFGSDAGTAEVSGTEPVLGTDPESVATLNAVATPAAAPRTRSIEYVNQHSTRNKPLSPKLTSVLDAATAPEGVTTRVISGGQPPAGGPSVRTGSHRHDEETPGGGGMAGDVQFIKDGRALDMTIPADLEIIKRIMGRIYGGGAHGLGASPAYMGSRTYHVGFGSDAVWGAGGQGKNAPAWLVEIANSGGIPGSAGALYADSNGTTSNAYTSTSTGGLRLGGGGGGGGGGYSGGGAMDARIQDFLEADAVRRRKLAETLPPIGKLETQADRVSLPGKNFNAASLAEILGVS